MTNAATDQAAFGIVERIYAAGCEPDQWPGVADACQRLFPGVAFCLHISMEGASHDPLPAWAGWDPSFIEKYKQYYHHANPYPEVLRAIPAGKVVRASHVVSRRWLDKQPFYHDWLKPAGNYTHGAGVTLVRSGGSVTRLSYDIPSGLAHIEGPTADMLHRLAPHFRRALEITHRLGGPTASGTAFAALIERITDCGIAIDRNRRVLYANRGALELLHSGKLINDVPFRGLAFVGHVAEETFGKALQGCLAIIERPSASSFVMHDGEAKPRAVHVLPLRPSASAATAGAGSAVALVVIGSDSAQRLPPERTLQATLGLSHRQAVVVLRICGGASVREAAEQLGVSLPTARNHLAAAMAKLGVHRRAELVGLLGGLLPRLNLDA